MKLLSIAVPCYNSQDSMEKALSSLLPGGEETEILIVDDGSGDRTAQIADEYERRYPGIVRAIHQENGGHGGAVMTGLKNASGLYFKVVDSDDWADADAYPKVLEALRSYREDPVDMLISNYIYDKAGARHKYTMRYTHALPQGRVFGWEETRHFRIGQYILMHSVIYRTQLLRDCGLDLPLHTFYVDELYVYVPLKQVERMVYLDVDFYHYFIGRDDQSVQEQVMIRRIDQQIRVTKIMLDAYDLKKIRHKYLRHYMLRYLEIMMLISSVFLVRSGTAENQRKKGQLWAYARAKHPDVYAWMNRHVLEQLLKIPGRPGEGCVNFCYTVARWFYGFN